LGNFECETLECTGASDIPVAAFQATVTKNRKGNSMSMHHRVLGLLCLVGMMSIAPAIATADVKLPRLIDSHMVLQRDMPVRLWGWADADEEVSVTIGKNSATAKANAEGKWKVELPAMKVDGKAHAITIQGKNKIELTDILVGEVWVGSGQSNMEWQLRSSAGSAEAIAAANHPNIRLFHVPKVAPPKVAEDINTTWKVCTPANAPNFSAVLYFFGKKLHGELDVPIGLINSSWGGSPIEPWTVKEDGSSGKMYNGMIAPLQPMSVRGVIWYQGETNVLHKNGFGYRDRMEALINGWRKTWDLDLPFYFVQIAPWSGRYEAGQLPALWEAQTASLKIPRTGMIVTTDLVDNIADIHPRNKVDVGDRLALWALAKTYEMKDIVYSGPIYKSMKVVDGKARLQFAHSADGLKSRDGKPLNEFQIAGADGKFVAATAEVDGTEVVVSADGVVQPTQVRFGWHKTANPNLINSAGLPASPFQTNNWRGGTGE
jgi:sialate O-acetylesterase